MGRVSGKLTGIVAQPFVEQGVDPPLGFVRFSCEVFVGYLRRYASAEPLLDEIGLEAIYVVPNAVDLLARPKEGDPLLEVAQLGEDKARGVLYECRQVKCYVLRGSPACVAHDQFHYR